MLEVISCQILVNTFFGFAAALLAEAIIRKFVNWHRKKKLLNALRKELKGVLKELQDLNKGEFYYDAQPYNIPIWNSACRTGVIGLLSNEEKVYNDYLEVFSYIQDGNLFERECFYEYELHDNKKGKDKLQSYRKDLEEKIVKKLGKDNPSLDEYTEANETNEEILK